MNINWKVALPLVLMFVVGGLNALVPVLPPTFQAIAMAVLPAIAAYYHSNAVTAAGSTQAN